MSVVKRIIKFTLLLISISCAHTVFADQAFKWPQKVWTNLDVGIYWVAPGNVYCKANNPNNSNPACAHAFDPTKPTMLFIHGWEPGSVRFFSRFDFYNKEPSLSKQDWDLANSWREKGWNVGVFYWNQISDTLYPSQAGAKIWTTKSSQKMYWKKYDPNAYWSYYHVVDENACKNTKSPYCQPVGDQLYHDYVQAMQGYQGNKIRIVGHSLGTQLAIYLTHKVAVNVAAGKLSPQLLPRRLVLLDPFFSPDNTYLEAVGINNRSLAGEYVRQIAGQYGIAVSEYLSSDVTLPDEWGPIEKVAALTYYRPWFDWEWREDEKHSAAWLIYFLSMKDPAPQTYVENILNNQPILDNTEGASASTPLFAENKKNLGNPINGIAAMMGVQYYWDQDCGEHGRLCGEYTLNTNNDAFLKRLNNANALLAIQITIHEKNGTPIQNGQTVMMATGTLQRFIAKLSPSDASNQMVLWQSSNPSVVKVFPGGYLKALKPGTAKITAIHPGLNEKLKILQESFTVNVANT